MTTLAEHIIVAGAKNRPPMLEKSMYDSWASRIRLFIKGKKHGRMMLDSIDNGPLVYPTVEENGQTRPKKYSELTEAKQLQDDCDVQATNIILHSLPPNLLYRLFDKFAYVQGETLYEYYWRFSQLINDMHTIGMIMQQVQVNTNLVVPMFQHGEDLIECINKAMAFLSAIATRGIGTTSKGNVTAGQPRVVKCYNCQGEGYMARQCTRPKRPRNAAWFMEKLMLVEAQEAGQILDEEQLAFLADPVDTVIRKLKDRIKSLSGKDSLEKVKKDIDEIETISIELEHKHCDSLIAQINAKSIENSDLNAQLQEKVFANATLKNELRKLKGENVVDTANNRDAHEVYIEKIIENTDTLRGFVKRARTQNPSEPLLESACMFTKHVQELLVYVSQTCPNLPKPSEKLVAVTPMNNDKRVRFVEPVTSLSNIPKQTDSLKTKDSNKPLLTSTGVKPTTSASGSKPSGNTKSNRISNALFKHSVRNANFESICAICYKCLFDANHDMCIINDVNNVNVRLKSKSKRNKMRKVWKPTGKVFTEIGYSWKPTGRNFTIIRNRYPLTRITSNKIVPPKETTITPVETPTLGILVYSRRPKATRSVGSSSKVKIVESKTSNSKEPKQSWGSTVSDVPSSSLNDCRFGNDHIAKIMGYGDYQTGNVTISRVYYVEGLGHNLFFVGQFCDFDLEVAFRKHTCFIRDLDGVDILKGSRGSNLYTLSMDNLFLSSPICLLSKASKTKSWLWHQRLSHLNFDYINSLAKQGLVRGLPKLKYQKDHLYYACALGKSKKHSYKPKAEDSIQEKLYMLHMDLCGPMRV
ncbi:integrase, catalytic region, zinc finger, CCHC-type containing protein [Tanacetum coccineum]